MRQDINWYSRKKITSQIRNDLGYGGGINLYYEARETYPWDNLLAKTILLKCPCVDTNVIFPSLVIYWMGCIDSETDEGSPKGVVV